MKAPPKWDHTQLFNDAATAKSIFRKERLDEPLAKWKAVFEKYRGNFEKLLEQHGAMQLGSITPEQVASIFAASLGDELRYLAGPPISADDLKVLAETTLATGVLKKDSAASKRVAATIMQALDSYRFPWIGENRMPTKAEKQAAILSSAAMLTKQRVQTDRANESKDAQEAAVKAYLKGMHFAEVNPRSIRTLADAPADGEFCAEALVGTRKADVPVRLYDGRLMPIECKVSNSSTNSVKRLNNDAAAKAGTWIREFGTNQIVPTAVLAGVFNVGNLLQAQESGLTIFWAHNLTPMQEFIESTRTR